MQSPGDLDKLASETLESAAKSLKRQYGNNIENLPACLNLLRDYFIRFGAEAPVITRFYVLNRKVRTLLKKEELEGKDTAHYRIRYEILIEAAQDLAWVFSKRKDKKVSKIAREPFHWGERYSDYVPQEERARAKMYHLIH
jgi:hypothetical protein